jgi:hypothetical protein
MTPEGHRGIACSTDETSRALEDLQFTLGAGPGPTAFDTGLACLVPDLGKDGGPAAGWPAFHNAALDLGVQAIFAFPLRLGAASLGVLSLYRTEAGALEGSSLASAVRLSNAAAVALLDLIVGVTANTQTSAYGSADGAVPDFYRAEIYQAAGVLMVQLDVTVEVAMMRLRSHAFATGRPAADVARDIVRHELRLEADSEPT